MARWFIRERHQDISDSLPTPIYEKGYRLVWLDPEDDPDPVDLRDKDGTLVHRWDYIPSLAEVFEICGKLGID